MTYLPRGAMSSGFGEVRRAHDSTWYTAERGWTMGRTPDARRMTSGIDIESSLHDRSRDIDRDHLRGPQVVEHECPMVNGPMVNR